MSLVLTLLYVPADRLDRAEKALASSADVVIVDLEDAVAPSAKAAARDGAASVLAADPDRDVQVRVNAPSTPWGADDLALVAGLPPSVSVRVPKVSSPADVAAVRSVLGDRPV